MKSEIFKNYCLSKKGAIEDFPFGADTLVIKIATKMFALFSKRENKICISLKCDPFLAEDLRQRFSSITPGYHLNKKHWNSVVIDSSVPEDEIYWMIDHSYELVLKSLTKSERESII